VCTWIVLLWSLLAPASARAGELEPVLVDAAAPEVDLVDVAVHLADPRPMAAWSEVLDDADWQPLPSRGSLGMLDGPHWIAIPVELGAPRELYLQMNEMGLERATFAHVVGDRVEHLSSLSRAHPLDEREVPHRTAVFRADLPEGASTLLLRFESHEAVQARLRLVDPERLRAEDRQVDLVWAGFVGLVLGLAAYNFFLWLSLRDRAYLLYVGMAVFTYALLLLHVGGVSYSLLSFLPPKTVQAIGFSLEGVGALAAAAFAWEFLQIRTHGRLFRPGFVLYAVLAVLLVAGPILPGKIPFFLALSLLGLMPILFVGAAVESWVRGHQAARWFLLAWASLCAGAVVTLLQSLGWLPLFSFQGGAMIAGAAAEAVLLSVALAARIRGLQGERRQAIRHAEAHRRRALQTQLSVQQQKGAFLSMMSHELRTPLHQVLGLTQLLELTETDHERRDQLTTVRSVGTGLLGMIDDMLLFTALREGRTQGLRTRLRVQDLVEGMARFQPACDAQDRELVLDGAPDPVELDSHLVARALEHLVDNAVKYGQGPVEVRARLQDGDLSVRVLDRGPGIPPEHIEAAFSLFEQDQAGMQRQRTGLGLGLAMCRAIAEALGGALELVEREGGGTCATLTVPGVSAAGYENSMKEGADHRHAS